MKTLVLIAILASPLVSLSQGICQTNYIELSKIVTGMGWVVTSEMGGGHNAHSRHYVGKAIDVSVRNKSQFDIDILQMIMDNQGYLVRDERVRPAHQRVWRGAHFHIGIPYCN